MTELDRPADAITVHQPHGFVANLEWCGSDIDVVNAARVSYDKRSDYESVEWDGDPIHEPEAQITSATLNDADAGLINYLLKGRHGTPFEMVWTKWQIKAPIFVFREWHRHRIACVAGDTVISFHNTKGRVYGRRKKTIEDLYRMQEGLILVRLRQGRGTAYSDYLRGVLASKRLRVMNEDTGVFVNGSINCIVQSGVKPLVALKVGDRTLRCTAEHRIWTPDGWRFAGNLRKGDWVKTAHEQPDRGTLVQAGVKWFALDCDPESLPAEMTYDLCANPPHHNFVANGFVTHNSINEMSGRYVELKPEFYLPDDDHVRVQVGKPGHYTYIPAGGELADPAIAGPSWAWNELGPSGAGPVTKGMLTRLQLERAFYHAFTAYQSLLSDGVAKEIARACLPVATYSEMYWACNLRALLNFLSLRNHPKALQEIRDYATVMEAELARHMPVTHAAFVANDKVAP